MRMDKYLRKLEQVEGEVTALTSLAGDMNQEKRSRKKRQRNSDEQERQEKNAEKSSGNVEAREAGEKRKDGEEVQSSSNMMTPPLEPLRSDDPYATTVKPVEREEPDSPAVGMMPWVD